MSDPAISAAQQAMAKVHGYHEPNWDLIVAAREMAKPIREAYMEILIGMPMNSMSLNMALHEILGVLGPLIFTTEELEELET